MSNQKAARLLAMHMFFVGLQSMSAIIHCRDRDALWFVFSTALAGFSGLCAYEFYGKLTEPTQDTP